MTTCDNTCHTFAIAEVRQKKLPFSLSDEVHPDSEKGNFKKDPAGKKLVLFSRQPPSQPGADQSPLHNKIDEVSDGTGFKPDAVEVRNGQVTDCANR